MFLSILTLTNYNDHVWDGFELPIGLDKDLAIQDICMQCAELELVYPDWNIMQTAISSWARRNAAIWQKLYETVTADYNFLWNVDATITEENSGENSGTLDSTNTGSVKGYNSNTWADADQNVIDNDTSGDWSESKSLRRFGNIGVTTSMALVKEQRETVVYDIYREITRSFMKEFCLLIY